MNISLLMLATSPVLFAFFFFELWYFRKDLLIKFGVKDSLTNIGLALMYQASDILFTLIIIKTLYVWVFNHGLSLFTINSWLNITILVAVQDFLYYWFHRSAHRIRWMWNSHVTHHSSKLLNFSTAFRQSMTYPISGMWAFWLPLAYLGFNPEMIIAVVALNLVFQFFVHTQMINKLPRIIEFIFNTPSHHRAHHGTNPQYIDMNYGGIFIIWDRIFGSFVAEEDAPIYGVAYVQPEGFNLLHLTFHEWINMFQQIKQTHDLRYLWKNPNWNSSYEARNVASIADKNSSVLK